MTTGLQANYGLSLKFTANFVYMPLATDALIQGAFSKADNSLGQKIGGKPQSQKDTLSYNPNIGSKVLDEMRGMVAKNFHNINWLDTMADFVSDVWPSFSRNVKGGSSSSMSVGTIANIVKAIAPLFSSGRDDPPINAYW